MIEVYVSDVNAKCCIVKSKIVAFYRKGEDKTMVMLDGYFTKEVEMNYLDFKRLMEK